MIGTRAIDRQRWNAGRDVRGIHPQAQDRLLPARSRDRRLPMTSAAKPSSITGVQVNETWRHDMARHVQHFGPDVRPKIGPDRGDPATAEADVRYSIEMLRRIDNPPA